MTIFIYQVRQSSSSCNFFNFLAGDEEDNCDEEDMSIPFGGTAAGAAEYRGHSAKSGNSSISRFSEITIEERRDRISAMITEIYTTVPMSRAHYGQGGRSLHDSMKKYASMDHVSDVGSIITTGASAIPARFVVIKMNYIVTLMTENDIIETI